MSLFIQKILHNLWNMNAHQTIRHSPHLGSATSQTSPVRIQIISFRCILILSSHFCLVLQIRLFLSRFSAETQYKFIFYHLCHETLPSVSRDAPICVTRRSHLIFLHVITLIIQTIQGTQVKFDNRI